jgi:Ca2+-binding RTX toxin-like protein
MTDWYSHYRTRPPTIQVWRRRPHRPGRLTSEPNFNYNTQILPNGLPIPDNAGVPRQGLVDTIQPVWGWFSGGGWAFGRTENSTHRITLETYRRYLDEDLVEGQPFTIEWAASDAEGATIIHSEQVIIGGDGPGHIPHPSSIRAIDQYAVVHDLALAQSRRDFAAATTDEARSNAKDAAITAHRTLVGQLRAYSPAEPQLADFGGDETAWEHAHNLWQSEVDYAEWVEGYLSVGVTLQSIFKTDPSGAGKQSFTLKLSADRVSMINEKFWVPGKGPVSIPIAELAQAFGSTLGRQLAGDDLVLGTLSGSLLGTIGWNVGQQIDVYRGVVTFVDGTKLTKDTASAVWSDFPNELAAFTANAAIGSTSSWLALELGEALGLEGFGAEMFSTGAGALLGHTLNNLVAQAHIFNGVQPQADWFKQGHLTTSGADALGSAFVSFFATKLASMVVPPQTQAAVVLSSLGAAAGSMGGFAGGFIGNFAAKLAFHAFGKSAFLAVTNLFKLIPGLGIFIGFVLGALIGNLFGRKKPRIPTANAEVVLQIPNAEYALGAVTQANGGNLDLVRAMGEAARDTLNGLIAVVTYGDESAKVANTFSPTQVYGHSGGQLWVKLGGPSMAANNVASADEAVDKGVLWALPSTQIVGGDMLLKRALYNMIRHPGQVTSVAQLSGDLQIADDYRFYLQNRAIIDSMIAEPYTSMKLATVDYLAFARVYVPATWNGAANTKTLETLYKEDAANADPNAKDYAKLRGWAETQWAALPATTQTQLLANNAAWNVAANADTAFYEANKAFMTRAMAKEQIALTGADLTFYNANAAKVDRIISRVALTQFAAAWIITLQRAAELELNRAAPSDFYGGAKGFIDGLGATLVGAQIDYESVRFALTGANNDLLVSYAPVGAAAPLNRFIGGDLSRGAAIAAANWNGGGSGHYVLAAETVDGAEALTLRKTGGTAQGWSTPNNIWGGSALTKAGDRPDGRFSVQPGEQLAYAYDAKDLTNSALQVWSNLVWYNAAGAIIGYAASAQVEANAWQRVTGTALVPVNAVYASIQLGSLRPDSVTNAAMDFAVRNLQFSVLPSGAGIPAWSGAPYEQYLEPKFLADAGYSTDMSTATVSYYDMGEFGGYYYYEVLGVNANNIALAAPTASNLTLDDVQIVNGGWSGGVFYADPYGASTGPVYGTGDDIFVASYGNDTLNGRVGHDWLDGAAGNDALAGGDGNDTLLGKAGTDNLQGELGDDTLLGGDGNDTLTGGPASITGTQTDNDKIYLGAGSANVATGGAGDDIFYAEAGGGATIDGGAGSDTISYRYLLTANLGGASDPSAWVASLNGEARGVYLDRVSGQKYGAAADDTVQNMENIEGSSFADWIKGDVNANTLKGLSGTDQLYGHDGADVLDGGEGADKLDGGAGADIASYKNSQAAVWVDWSASEAFGGDAEGDTYVAMEDLEGSKFADTFKGNASANRFTGLAGDDWFIATLGADAHDGGGDFDTVDYADATGGIGIDLALGIGSGAAYTHTFTGIEHIVGSGFFDTISGSGADETFSGGGGNDVLNGGAGSDTYVFYRGDGADSVNESNAGDNIVVFGDGITWSDLTLSTPSGTLTLQLRNTTPSDQMAVASNFAVSGNNRLKAIDMGGAGAIDVSAVTWTLVGTDAAATHFGGNRVDWIVGHGGNDTIHGAATSTAAETFGNIVIGGAGNDVISLSGGDDQIVFERGHGRDTLTDTGGEEMLILGPTVAAEDVIFKIVGNDLYIGLRDLAAPTLAADQVADYVKVIGGGVKNVGMVYGGVFWNTLEFIRAGGAEINLLKLDLNWTVQEYWDGGGFPPIVFDLGGDGLDLIAVEGSQVVISSGEGEPLYRTGWVGQQDGFLAIDRDKDGAITRLSEISFLGEKKGATTDLEGLAGLDSNEDGVLNAKDARWGELKLWRDVNENGRGYGKEVVTLDEAGIVEIGLKLSPTGFGVHNGLESVVLNTATFVWADGRIGTVHDVMLAQKLAHIAGFYAGEGEKTPPPSEGELGRAVAGDGAGDGRANVGFGQATPDQDLIFVRADGGDGVEDLPPIVPVVESLAALAEAEAKLAGAAPAPSAGGGAPIVIDMGGDGLSLVDPMNSTVLFDLNQDGWRDRLGWVGAGEAILGLDRDQDGLINVLSEISFIGDGADTDLEGLAAFDTNNNALLDAGDARFGDFKLWTDANQDGSSTLGEVQTLSQAGLISLALTPTDAAAEVPSAPTANVVLQTVAANFADGSTRQAGDVVLGSRSGLALALDAARGDASVVGAPAPGPRFDTLGLPARWALNDDVRRLLLDGGADGGDETPMGGASAPQFGAREDAAGANLAEDAAPGAPARRTPNAPLPNTPLIGGGEAETPHFLRGADASETEAQTPAAAASQRERWWRRPAAGKAPALQLGALMARLSAASIGETGAASLRAERALPLSPAAARELDALVQARAALGGAGGGEARRAGAGGLDEAALALPNAWRRDRLRKAELA